jgi:hypothetical protein
MMKAQHGLSTDLFGKLSTDYRAAGLTSLRKLSCRVATAYGAPVHRAMAHHEHAIAGSTEHRRRPVLWCASANISWRSGTDIP